MSAVQLKALCKEQGLKVSGKKTELQARLREHFLEVAGIQKEKDEFDSMSDDDLRQSLTARALDSSGDRATLLARLRSDIKYIRELESALPPDGEQGFKTISDLLEAAAAEAGGAMSDILAEIKAKPKDSKWIDVTISSLGMTPQKYTSGGAPSVTATVLKELAGNPLADPPKYGTVSAILTTRCDVQ